MTQVLRVCVCAVGLLLFTAASFAQGTNSQNPISQGESAAHAAAEHDLAAIVPLRIQVVLSKYQGDKKISSLPYELTVRTDGRAATLRMGAQVPVPNVAFGATANATPTTSDPDAARREANRMMPFNYHDAGTNIDCTATRLDGARFAITITIEDSSVYANNQTVDIAPRLGGIPVFRTFRATNALVLIDNQSAQFTMATDKVSGEVLRAEVTATVIK